MAIIRKPLWAIAFPTGDYEFHSFKVKSGLEKVMMVVEKFIITNINGSAQTFTIRLHNQSSEDSLFTIFAEKAISANDTQIYDFSNGNSGTGIYLSDYGHMSLLASSTDVKLKVVWSVIV